MGEGTILALLTWNDAFSVQVKKFDEQHHRLFDCLNELYDAMKKGAGASTVGGVLAKLLQYTKEHFTDEEAAMKQIGYPGLESQKVAHRLLTAQVESFVKRFQAGELALSVSLMEFLKDWLEKHIVGTDKEYSAFMNEHGVK